MPFQSIILSIAGNVAEISLNRPHKRNAINGQMGEELIAALNLCAKDNNVNVVILMGEGKSFCAGIDIGELSSPNKKAIHHYLEESTLNRIFQAMRSIRKPLISVTHGYTMGAGLGLAALSHFVMAAEDAKFGLPEINLGLYPLGVVSVLWQLVGPKRVLQLGLLGDQFGVDKASELGLVDYVYPGAVLNDKARELAEKLSKKGNMALLAGIDSFNVLMEEDFRKNSRLLNLMLIPFMDFKVGQGP